MADQTREFGGRTRAGVPPGLTAVMAVLVAATVVAVLYSAREVVVPITLAVLLSFLLAPGVRWLRRLGWAVLLRSPELCCLLSWR